MVYSGRKTVTTHGTPVALASSRTMASWLTIAADRNNAGTVYVGGVDENHAVAVKNAVDNANLYVGHPLIKPAAATSTSDFVNFREIGGPAYIDLSQVYVDADTSADKVTFNYGRR